MSEILKGSILVDEGGQRLEVVDTTARAGISQLSEEIISKPTDAQPYKQLVTDGDGKTVWEYRTHYKYERIAIKLSPKFDSGSSGSWSGGSGSKDPVQVAAATAVGRDITSSMGNGAKWVVYWDGTSYELAQRRLPIVVNPGGSYPFGLVVMLTPEGCSVNIKYNDDQDHTFEWVLTDPPVKKLDDIYMPKNVPALQNASSGQIVSVKSIDGAGEPSEYFSRMLGYSELGERPTVPAHSVLSIEWDGNIEGRLGGFQYPNPNNRNWKYYHVSYVVPPYEGVERFYAEHANGLTDTTFAVGTNCYHGNDLSSDVSVPSVIVVTKAGLCATTQGYEFYAPVVGIYMGYISEDVYWRKMEIEGLIPDRALRLYSSNGKPYNIIVDDNGTLTATEVTE